MRIAILGCGPAGLLAAWAALLENHEVAVFSKKQKSQISGAQYLHSAIPDITSPEPERMIRYFKIGTGPGYSQKVYGTTSTVSSWERWKAREYPAWSLRGAYDRLWEPMEPRIRDIGFIDYDYVRALMEEFEVVINTIPLKHICKIPESCRFYDQPTWITDWETPFLPENTILYNGLDFPRWHRASYLDGYFAVEYGYPVEKAHMILKPQGTTCQCWPTGSQRFFSVGRYGTWTRDVLTHDAFHETRIRLT